ncbi:MAG: hypothetical protein ABEJ57_05910 [Halobacteriaceae archaeon]
MIVVATADFEVYHGVVGELRDRGLQFTTIEPGDPLPDACAVLLTGAGEAWTPSGVPVVRADPGEPRAAVDEAVALLREAGGRTVVGVDPGDRPGVAVLSGAVVVAVFQVPLADVVEVIRSEIEDATDSVVRVGDGARLSGAKIVEELDDVRVELVDETGTTPHLGTGARGMGDVLAAVNIARRPGEPVGSLAVDPTPGEIQAIQNRSREVTGSATLPADLARQVATGELSMAEAIAEHGSDDEDES